MHAHILPNKAEKDWYDNIKLKSFWNYLFSVEVAFFLFLLKLTLVLLNAASCSARLFRGTLAAMLFGYFHEVFSLVAQGYRLFNHTQAFTRIFIYLFLLLYCHTYEFQIKIDPISECFSGYAYYSTFARLGIVTSLPQI